MSDRIVHMIDSPGFERERAGPDRRRLRPGRSPSAAGAAGIETLDLSEASRGHLVDLAVAAEKVKAWAARRAGEGDRGAGRAVRDRPRSGLRPRPRGRPRAGPGGHHPVALLGPRGLAARRRPEALPRPGPGAAPGPGPSPRGGSDRRSTSPSDRQPRRGPRAWSGRAAGRRHRHRPGRPRHHPRVQSRSRPRAARWHPHGLVDPGPPAAPDPDPHGGRARPRDRPGRDRGRPARSARRALRLDHRPARRAGPARPGRAAGRHLRPPGPPGPRRPQRRRPRNPGPAPLRPRRRPPHRRRLRPDPRPQDQRDQPSPPDTHAKKRRAAAVPGRGHPDQRHRRRPTLLGLDNTPAVLHTPTGDVPIPAELARALAHDPEQATWRRILCDPATGTAIEVSTGYRPAPRIAQFCAVRDGHTTRFPTSAARTLELDHIHEYDHRHPPPAARPPRPTWPPPANATTKPKPTASSTSPATPTASSPTPPAPATPIDPAPTNTSNPKHPHQPPRNHPTTATRRTDPWAEGPTPGS